MFKKFFTVFIFVSVTHLSIAGTSLNNPILFVTQFPIANDFTTIGSTFGNHSGEISVTERGGNLYFRSIDETLRNLTKEVGFGTMGFQGNDFIAVRDPAVHWSANKALSSMLTDAPTSAIFDDFEDGDANDWFFFNGNAAGGGGGVFADHPQEGSFYLGTGWGGEGTASSFYGGFLRNLENSSQLTLPSDPWFNVWVLNQSDSTVDSYTLEITIREDTDGNGWSDGSDDSFGLNTTFPSTSFDNQWTLISAPVNSFIDRGTGGDGTFDGNLDEMVLVIAGVTGASGSVIEVNFDLITFTSGGPIHEVIFSDGFEVMP